MVIQFTEFDSYKNLSTKDKNSTFYHPDYTYELGIIPKESLQNEFYKFIKYRGNKLTYKSLYQDRRAFILTAEFLAEKYPQLETLLELPLEDAMKQIETWLTNKGIVAHPKTNNGTTLHASIRYLQQAYRYYLPKDNFIYFKELECYKHISEKEKHSKHYAPESYFDLNQLPKSIREDFRALITKRGQQLRFTSMSTERQNFNHLCKFINDKYDSLEFDDNDAFYRSFRVWAMKNKYSPTVMSKRKTSMEKIAITHPFFEYAKMVANYFTNSDSEFRFEENIWKLENIDTYLKLPAITNVKTLNFNKVKQDKIRNEIKEVALFRLKEVTVRTVTAEIHAVVEFSKFLHNTNSNLCSLKEVDREIIEEYLIYLNTEDKRRKNYRTELMHLKSAIETLGLIEEDMTLTHLFIPEDFPKNSIPVYRFYTDAELRRLNAGFQKLDPQTGRLMIIHELLGCRISETLTLKTNCITKSDEGKYYITIEQSKVNQSYNKVINKDIVTLIEKSIAYTTELYGECEFVFVSDKDPSKPFQYGALYYRLQCMIIENDLRDDHGQLFTVGTHLFRKTYGKRLCDMGLDDVVIAKLLGHHGTSSVKHYRRMSSAVLANATSNMRTIKGEMIRNINGRNSQYEK